MKELPDCFPQWLSHGNKFPCTLHASSNFPHPYQRFLAFSIITLLVGIRYLIVVLMCISPMANDVDIFPCAYCPFVYFLRNDYSEPLPLFKIELLSLYYWVVRAPFIFCMQVPYYICDLGILSCIMSCIFILFMAFVVQEFLFFITCAFGVVSTVFPDQKSL